MSWIRASSVTLMLVGSLVGGAVNEGAFVSVRGFGVLRRCRPAETGGTRALAAKKGFGGVEKKAPKKTKVAKGVAAKRAAKASAVVSSGFAYTGSLRPGVQSPRRTVPPEIGHPDYAEDGMPKGGNPPPAWVIEVKTEEDIAGMRAAGKVAREVLDLAGKAVQLGATTDDVDRACHEAALERGAYPSPLNYFGFPKSCCTSINEIVCHGIPDSTVLEDGMVVNVDVTVFYKGYHGDCSEMFMVGEVDQAGKDLVQATYDIFNAAIAYCKPGRPYSGIGGVIQEMVDERGYSTISNFCGHGIGKTFHANPYVLHHKNDVNNGIMAVGHTFTIEPLICEGTDQNLMWPDKWTAATADGKRTAQFEHTFLLTEGGAVPLTAKLDSSPRQFWEK
ncbi:unnamed protein product [Ectocarpus fasciculatus]